jgi:hypothetical protein
MNALIRVQIKISHTPENTNNIGTYSTFSRSFQIIFPLWNKNICTEDNKEKVYKLLTKIYLLQ